MKRRPETEPPAMAGGGEAEETGNDTIEISSSADVCKSLMERYAKSCAPQHRHLIASAAAMRSILLEEGLPLTPPAYFAAAITAFRESDHSDADATAALSAFISILLSLESVRSVVPPAKAKDAAFVLASFLKESASGLATGTVRSVINSLGFLALCVDLEDWSAVELPLQTLLVFAIHKRPKVRRCAQVYVGRVFKTLHGSFIIKKASKVVLSMYRENIHLVKKLQSTEISDAAWKETLSKYENMEFLHMLNVIKEIVPFLSLKVVKKILSDAYNLLGCHFLWLTRHILSLLEALLEHSKVEMFVSESEDFFSSLTSYVSFVGKNPVDTAITALELFKNGLNKLRDEQPVIWIKYLPLVITQVAGLLSSDAHIAARVADILKQLVNNHVDWRLFQSSASPTCSYEKMRSPEAVAVASICSVFDKMFSACDAPTEYMLAVISALFLKLGEFSYLFMKEILLKLSQKAMQSPEELLNMKNIESCMGAAVIAMKPEKVLALIPVSFHAESLTCSNTWLIPILKRYTVGASLQYFMEHIVPLARSVQIACSRVKKAAKQKRLQSIFHDLWDLLPAFCRCPSDIPRSYEDLAKLIIVVLKEDQSLHQTISRALQELVNGNKKLLSSDPDAKPCVDLPSELNMESRNLLYVSKKTASRNMKAISCSSMDLFCTLVDAFFDSSLEKRSYLKDAIGCLASVLGSGTIESVFVSSLKNLNQYGTSTESRKLEDQIDANDHKEGEENAAENEKYEEIRRLVMEIASSFVETADRDLINMIFDFIRSSLLARDEFCQLETYNTLCKILKEHNWFTPVRIDELMDLLFSTKPPTDSTVLECRFSCFHYLLVHMLKSNEENMNTKAFLILNEIILTLKSKKESRKLAYNVLLTISSSLKNSQYTSSESDLRELFNMVMGYLTSSSPHIISGAVSALSLLIYNDAGFCLAVPNLVPSVLALLQNKAIEVIKATLGFIKVLVSSLDSNDLMKPLPDILNGILPWSSVSKHHFRSKVAIILEILIRKCGSDAVGTIVPVKYEKFLEAVEEGRRSKKKPMGVSNSETATVPADSVTARGHNRAPEGISGPLNNYSRGTSGNIQKEKRRKKRKERGTPSTDKRKIGSENGGNRSTTGSAALRNSAKPFLGGPRNAYKRKRNEEKSNNRCNFQAEEKHKRKRNRLRNLVEAIA